MLAWVTMWYVSSTFGERGGVCSFFYTCILYRSGKLICRIVKVDFDVQLHVYLTIQNCLADEIVLASAY